MLYVQFEIISYENNSHIYSENNSFILSNYRVINLSVDAGKISTRIKYGKSYKLPVNSERRVSGNSDQNLYAQNTWLKCSASVKARLITQDLDKRKGINGGALQGFGSDFTRVCDLKILLGAGLYLEE